MTSSSCREDFENPSGGAGARLLAPIYQGGRLNANVRIRTLQQEEALAAYAGTALQALNDVENAIAASRSLAARSRALGAAFGEQQRALELTETSLRVGRADRRALEQQRTVGGQCAHRDARGAGRGARHNASTCTWPSAAASKPRRAAAAVIPMPVRYSIEFSRSALRRLFLQRCFYLFMLLLALITVSPFMEGARGGYLLAGLQRLHRALGRRLGRAHRVVVSAGVRA